MSTLHASLIRIRELAPELNKVSDEATRIVQGLEDLLAKELFIGTRACVAFVTKLLSPKKRSSKELCYCRIDNKFRIAVVETLAIDFVDESGQPQHASEERDLKPWAESPRDVKLESFPYLPQLLEEIVKRSESVADSVRKTQDTIEQNFPGTITTNIRKPFPPAELNDTPRSRPDVSSLISRSQRGRK